MRAIFCCLFICFSYFAYAQPSNVLLSSEKGEKFTVVLNGEKQNKTPVSKLHLKNLDAPAYKVKVIFTSAKHKPVLKTLTLEPGFESVYLLKKIGKQYKIVFVSSGHIPGNSMSPSTIDTLATRENIRIDPSPKVKPVFIPGYVGQIGCPRPMSSNEFSGVKKKINAKNIEEDKLQVIHQVITSNCMLSSQVREILYTLNAEKNRLESAKLAYSHTYDIGNYNKVTEAFIFEASLDEFNKYLHEKNTK